MVGTIIGVVLYGFIIVNLWNWWGRCARRRIAIKDTEQRLKDRAEAAEYCRKKGWYPTAKFADPQEELEFHGVSEAIAQYPELLDLMERGQMPEYEDIKSLPVYNRENIRGVKEPTYPGDPRVDVRDLTKNGGLPYYKKLPVGFTLKSSYCRAKTVNTKSSAGAARKRVTKKKEVV